MEMLARRRMMIDVQTCTPQKLSYRLPGTPDTYPCGARRCFSSRTSLIRKRPTLGPYTRPMHVAL